MTIKTEPAIGQGQGGTTTGPLALESGERLALCGGQSLLVRRAQPYDLARDGASEPSRDGGVAPAGEVLTLVDAAGVARLTIRVTPEATTIELGGGPGAAVRLAMEGDLAIDARRVSLHAREHLSISSGQDIVTHAEETITQSARRQSLTATLGDLGLAANDDIRVEGERIRMNC